MAYDKFRQEATYEAPDVQPDQGLYKHAFATAMQQDFQRAEGDKNRDEAQKDAERKRLLTYKVGDEKFKFTKDVNDAQAIINSASSKVLNGVNPESDNQELKRRADLSGTQYERYNKQIDWLAKKNSEGFVPKSDAINNHKKATEDADVDTRNTVLDKFETDASVNPSSIFDTDNTWNVAVNNEKNFPTQTYKSSRTIGSHGNTSNTTIERKGKFFIPTNELEIDANGIPIQGVFKQKPVSTIQEAQSLVPRLLESGKISKEYVSLEADNIYSDKNKRAEIDNKVNEFANSDAILGRRPNENEIDLFKKKTLNDYAESKIAERILNEEKINQIPNVSTSNIQKEATETEKNRSFNRSFGDRNAATTTAFTSANEQRPRDLVIAIGNKPSMVQIKPFASVGLSKVDEKGKNIPIKFTTVKESINASNATKIPQGTEMTATGIVLMAKGSDGNYLPTKKSASTLQKEGKSFDYFIEGKVPLTKENKAIQPQDKADWDRFIALSNKPYVSPSEQPVLDALEAKFAKQGHSNYVIMPFDNDVANEIGHVPTVDAFMNLSGSNRKLKAEHDKLNKGVYKNPNPEPKKMIVRGAGAKPVYEGKVVNKGGKKLGE